MLKTLTGEQIEDTAEHLATRVQHRSPNVKLKALRCVKWLCQRGNEPRFRRAMTKRSGPVRTCVSHTGRPDPQRGDAPHKAVRDMAKETLEAMFANDANRGGGGGRMEGFGSDAAAPHTGATYASHDASFDGNEQLGSWGGVAEPTNGFGGDEATAIIGDGPARLNKISGTWGAPEPPRAPPPAPTPSPPPAPAAAAAVAAASTPSPDPALRLASRDIWGQPAQPAARQPARQPAPPVQPPSPPLSPVAAGANAPFALEGSEEQRRVDALCAGGGVKLAPNSSEMDAFAAACGGLRPEGVARALAVKIRGGEWREGYRAACVLEHVAKGRGGGCEAVAFAFASAETDALDAAAAASAGSHELLRAKAAEAKAAVDSRVKGVANRSTNGPPAASNAPVAGGGGVDLFGLMGDGTTPAAAPAAAAATSFDAFAVAPPPAAPPAAPAAFAPPPDLLGGFGDMSLGGGGAHAPASAPPAPAPGVDPFGGLLGGLSPPPPVVQTGGAMFGGLNPSMMTAKPSSSRSPSSPTALNGKQSTYQQHKDAKAFDFVSDMLKKK